MGQSIFRISTLLHDSPKAFLQYLNRSWVKRGGHGICLSALWRGFMPQLQRLGEYLSPKVAEAIVKS
jgi:hypothetical protein